jgi:hypothetical protein
MVSVRDTPAFRQLVDEIEAGWPAGWAPTIAAIATEICRRYDVPVGPLREMVL